MAKASKSSDTALDSDIILTGQFCEEYGLHFQPLDLDIEHKYKPTKATNKYTFKSDCTLSLYLIPRKFIILCLDILIPADTLVRKDRFVQVMDGEGGVPLGKNHPPTMEEKHEVFVLFQI